MHRHVDAARLTASVREIRLKRELRLQRRKLRPQPVEAHHRDERAGTKPVLSDVA